MTDEGRNRILIVDDELINLKILSNILSGEYVLSVAMNGPQALEIARRQAPDLILLDIVMPKMSGIDVCKELKADEDLEHIPVIFVTSMDDETNAAVGLAVGACDYIAKPVSPAIMLARVKTHLQNRSYAEFVEGLLSETQLDQVKKQARKLQ